MSNNVNNEKTPTTMSYEDFLKEQRNIANANAEKAYESAVNTAQGLYSRALSGYGAQGEKYSNMGLKGSGYTQYLDGQAMAQRNAAIANANRTKADAYTAAENAYNTQYQTYLQQQQQNAATAFNDILTNIDQYSLGDIKYLGGQYKMNDDQIKYLVESALKADNYTVSDLDAVREKIGEDAYTAYYNKLTNANIDTSENAFIYTDEDNNTQLYTANEARQMIDNLKQREIPQEKIAALENAYNKTYKVQTVEGLKMKGNTFKNINGTELGAGDDFEITDGKNRYHVESGGKVEDSNIITLASNLDSGTVFQYQGAIYVKYNGEVFKVKARPLGTNFTKLTDLFNNKPMVAATIAGALHGVGNVSSSAS